MYWCEYRMYIQSHCECDCKCSWQLCYWASYNSARFLPEVCILIILFFQMYAYAFMCSWYGHSRTVNVIASALDSSVTNLVTTAWGVSCLLDASCFMGICVSANVYRTCILPHCECDCKCAWQRCYSVGHSCTQLLKVCIFSCRCMRMYWCM